RPRGAHGRARAPPGDDGAAGRPAPDARARAHGRPDDRGGDGRPDRRLMREGSGGGPGADAGVHLRTYAPSDYAAVTALWRSVFGHLKPEDEPGPLARAVERNPGLFVVAESAGTG